MESKITQLTNIYDVWYKPWWYSKYFYISVTLLVVIAVLLVGYYIWHYFAYNKKLSYDELILIQLHQLTEQPYDLEGQIQDGYFALTMILKKYLSNRYEISLLHKTDSEITEHIKSQVPAHVFAILQEFLDRSFQIKFAKATASKKMLLDDIAFGKQLVKETMKADNNGASS